jgi:hypothetical protein
MRGASTAPWLPHATRPTSALMGSLQPTPWTVFMGCRRPTRWIVAMPALTSPMLEKKGSPAVPAASTRREAAETRPWSQTVAARRRCRPSRAVARVEEHAIRRRGNRRATGRPAAMRAIRGGLTATRASRPTPTDASAPHQAAVPAPARSFTRTAKDRASMTARHSAPTPRRKPRRLARPSQTTASSAP